MRILVTTPTGNIGRRIVDLLLEATHDLTLLVRDPSKLSPAIRARTRVVQGTLESEASLDRALVGADAAFLLIPPPAATVTHWRDWQTAIGNVFASAAARADVQRVVLLSSSGAQHDDLSAISGLGNVERILRDAMPNVVALRAGYFMENTLGSLSTIAQAGAVYGVIPATRSSWSSPLAISVTSRFAG